MQAQFGQLGLQQAQRVPALVLVGVTSVWSKTVFILVL